MLLFVRSFYLRELLDTGYLMGTLKVNEVNHFSVEAEGLLFLQSSIRWGFWFSLVFQKGLCSSGCPETWL